MAFTDRNPKTILHSWGRFKAMVYEDVVVGDLLAVKEHATTGCFQLADDSNGYAAVAIACQNGSALDTIWMCLAAEMKAPASVGTGGVVTQSYFIGAAEVLGDELFLGESGKIEHTIGTTTKQHIGYALSRDRIIVVPGHVLGSVAGSFTTLAASGATSLSDTLGVTGIATFAALPVFSMGISIPANKTLVMAVTDHSGDDAIIPLGMHTMSKGSAGAHTLAAPTAGAVCAISAKTAHAHVVTTGDGITYDGTNNTATFGGAVGDSIVLIGISATLWAVLANNNVTLSSV